MSDRCEGHCCEAFTLRLSHAEFKKRLADGEPYVDGEQIDEMLIELYSGPVEGAPPGLVGKTDLEPNRLVTNIFTCKHYVKGFGCSIYETRPQMCRAYPNGGKCHYKQCAWKAAREGRTVFSPKHGCAVERPE